MNDRPVRRRRHRRRSVGKPWVPLLLLLIPLLALVCRPQEEAHPDPALPSLDTTAPAAQEPDIPDELLSLKEAEPELAAFVDGYPACHDVEFQIDLSAEAQSGTIPLLLQWDRRWGYHTYGSSWIATTACGPTCLSMVAIGLTGDATADPLRISRYADEHGYFVEGSGTSWTLISEGCTDFGLKAWEVPLHAGSMCQELNSGHPIICALGPGDFTAKGHFIVLTGYDDTGFTVNDPNSAIRSARTWSYEALEPQIRGLWALCPA